MDKNADIEVYSDLLQKTDKEVMPSLSLEGHLNSVDCLKFNPSKSNSLISGSFDKTIIAWDVNTGKKTEQLKSHSEGVWCLDYSKDGSIFVSGSADKTIKIWDSKSMSEVSTLSGHTDHVYSIQISSDSTKLISASEDGKVKIWDLKQRNCISSIETGAKIIYSAKCDEAQKNLFVTDSAGFISIFDFNKGNLITKSEGYKNTEIPNRIYNTSFDPQYANDIFASIDNGRYKRYSYIDQSLTLIHEEPAHLDQCKSVNMNSSIKRLVTTCKDGTAKLWDTTNNKLQCLFVGFTDATTSAAFPIENNCKVVAISSWDQTVKLFPLNA